MTDLWQDTFVPVQGMGLQFTVGLPLVGLTETAIMEVTQTTLAGDMTALANDLAPLPGNVAPAPAPIALAAPPVRPSLPSAPPVEATMPAALAAALARWI